MTQENCQNALKPKSVFCALILATFALCYIAQTKQVNAQDKLISIPESPLAPQLANLDTLNVEFAVQSELKDKVILVNFWASWCSPCIKEFPVLQSLWEQFDRSQFEILAINASETREAVESFFDRMFPDLGFIIVLDPELELFNSWRVRGLPTTYLVDRSSRMRYKAIGSVDQNYEELLAKVTALVQEQSH